MSNKMQLIQASGVYLLWFTMAPATPSQAMLVPLRHLPHGGIASVGILASTEPSVVDDGIAAKNSSVLRSAALVRQRGLRFSVQSESPDVSQAALRAHFSQVISILLQQSEKSLAVACQRLRKAHVNGWSRAEHERWSTMLRVNRALQIERLRQYARRGFFPINECHSSGPIPIFVDRHDTACAVGHLMRESGWNDAVEEIARHNLHVYVPDVHDGPLVQWVLQSGLTQEEATMIQPSYGPSCRPFADLNLDGVVDASDAEVHDLSGWDFREIDLTGAFDLMDFAWPCDYDLTGANLSGQNLANAALSHSTITGAVLADAVVTGAWFNSSLGFTKEQLYSTASYQAMDLQGIGLGGDLSFPRFVSDLAGWDFAGQNLTSAHLDRSDLSGADFSGANLTGADLGESTLTNADFKGAVIAGAYLSSFSSDAIASGGLTREQLYSTASYQAKDLRGIGLPETDLGGWDFSGQNLNSARLYGSDLSGADFSAANLTQAAFSRATTLTNANLTGADTRGAYNLDLTDAVVRNSILPDGRIKGFELAANEKMLVRDHDGVMGSSSELPIPVTIEDHMRTAEGSILELLFDADPWGSLISFKRHIPVQLGGALDLVFADDVDLSSQVGRTVRIFDWRGVSPVGQFQIQSPYVWNTTKLYTTGEVTLVVVPEPGALLLMSFGLLIFGKRFK